MASEQVKFYKAKCLKSVVVPTLGRCNVGETYELNEWLAKSWGGKVIDRKVDQKTKEVLKETDGSFFDVDWKHPEVRTIRLSDEPQAEYNEKKKKQEEARKAAQIQAQSEGRGETGKGGDKTDESEGGDKTPEELAIEARETRVKELKEMKAKQLEEELTKAGLPEEANNDDRVEALVAFYDKVVELTEVDDDTLKARAEEAGVELVDGMSRGDAIDVIAKGELYEETE